MDREQLRRDLEQLGHLAPTLGNHAQRETPLDVVVGVDPAFADLLATTIVEGQWWLDGEPIGERWTDLITAIEAKRRRQQRRKERRAAARVRKDRRGWR